MRKPRLFEAGLSPDSQEAARGTGRDGKFYGRYSWGNKKGTFLWCSLELSVDFYAFLKDVHLYFVKAWDLLLQLMGEQNGMLLWFSGFFKVSYPFCMGLFKYSYSFLKPFSRGSYPFFKPF